MLYNFDTMKYYEIDLRCFDEEHERIVYKFPFLSDWVTRWKRALEETYKINSANLETIGFHNYQEQIIYEKAMFYLTFNVDRAKKLVKNGKFQVTNFETEELISWLNKFQPLEVEKRNINEPLIALPLPLKKWGSILVIDGNHRLSVASKYKIKTVPLYLIEDIMTIRAIMPSLFEKTYYTYLIDTIGVQQMIEYECFSIKNTLLHNLYN